MMPTMCDGSNFVNGKPKPVALVATVAARNTAVFAQSLNSEAQSRLISPLSKIGFG